ncbi:hypothetical protein ACN47E_000059 [Coniothyrium glycines]
MDYLRSSFTDLGISRNLVPAPPTAHGPASATLVTNTFGQSDRNKQPEQDITRPMALPEHDMHMRASDFHTATSIDPQHVIKVLHSFIQQERQRNFSFLANHSHKYMAQAQLLVVSLADMEEVVRRRLDRDLPRPAPHEMHWYTFTEMQDSNSLDHTVAVASPSYGNISIDDLELFDPCASMSSKMTSSAAAWIRMTYDWNEKLDWEMRFTEDQFEEQRLWWQGTGQHFRLLDLPLELRETVYLQVIGPVVVPIVHSSTNKDKNSAHNNVLGHGHSYGPPRYDGARRDPNVHPPNLDILRTNKQIHGEALKVAYCDTTKRLRHNARNIIETILAESPHPAFLRRVQLELSALHYFQSIAIKPAFRNPWRKSASSPPRSAPRPASSARKIPAHISNISFRLSDLTVFPSLHFLDLRFISPKHATAVCPWTRALDPANHTDHSCQKVWIDYFLVFAWDTLRHLHARGVALSLSGCIKHSTRAKWQPLLNDTRADHTAEMAARKLEVEQEKNTDGPIPCTCSTRCGRGGPELFRCSEYEVRRIEGMLEEKEKVYWDFED